MGLQVLRSPVCGNLLVVVATIVFIAVNAGLSIYWDRRNAVAEHEALARDLASAVADQAARSVRDTDLALGHIGEIARSEGGLSAFDERRNWDELRRIAETIPGGTGVFVADAAGRVVASSTARQTPQISVADRAYVRELVESNILHIGPATFSKIDPDKVIYTISRRITDAHGNYIGIASAGVAAAHLTDFYDLLGFEKDTGVAVFRADGDVIARRPNVREFIGRSIAHRPLFMQMLKRSPQGVFRARSPLDDVDRINAYRVIGPGGLVVLVAIPWEVVTAAADRRALWTVLLALASIAVIALTTIWANASSRRAARASVEREEAVAARERASAELRRAMHDHLTGLPGRALFMAQADQTLFAGQSCGRHAAVMILDLDGFKGVNDAFGHHKGDEVLISTAGILREVLHESAVIGRLGGDEFGICFHAEPDRVAAQVDEAAGRLVDEIARIGMGISCSLGVAICSGDCAGLSTALRRADEAMYLAKRAGKRRSAIWSETLRNEHHIDLAACAAPDERRWPGR